MSPLSGGVLTAATLVASPALWSSLVDGTMPLDVALTRYLIAVGVCWLLLSIVVEFAFPSAKTLAAAQLENEAAEEAETVGPDQAA
ncbi:hypothetical protein [Marmoricola sp. RAF53]|uniref:hypothetical protein n=1 Tax=Marmoricola sp. RAF53 TaxID=3233059 RepID=UPI003F95C89A